MATNDTKDIKYNNDSPLPPQTIPRLTLNLKAVFEQEKEFTIVTTPLLFPNAALTSNLITGQQSQLQLNNYHESPLPPLKVSDDELPWLKHYQRKIIDSINNNDNNNSNNDNLLMGDFNHHHHHHHNNNHNFLNNEVGGYLSPVSTTISKNPISACLLPWLPSNVPLLNPLLLPVDAFNVDGTTAISLLSLSSTDRDCPELCRFCYSSDNEEALHLMGDLGIKNQNESYVYPSLKAALSYQKNHDLKKMVKNNGWDNFYVLIVHEQRTYRCLLSRFINYPNKKFNEINGPGFCYRQGLKFTEEEVSLLTSLALLKPLCKVHESKESKESNDTNDKIRNVDFNSDLLPGVLTHLLPVIPTIIQPNPLLYVMNGSYILRPVRYDSCPTFMFFNHSFSSSASAITTTTTTTSVSI
jgi:hypothetical protein